jgi:hypothetical protein
MRKGRDRARIWPAACSVPPVFAGVAALGPIASTAIAAPAAKTITATNTSEAITLRRRWVCMSSDNLCGIQND